jgi:hypothetical protein
MTDRRGSSFNPANRGRPAPGRKGPKGSKGRHQGKGGSRKRVAEPLLEQPIADSTGAVPCRLCGHPVDPKRLHFHMVRFHGAALRTPRP